MNRRSAGIAVALAVLTVTRQERFLSLHPNDNAAIARVWAASTAGSPAGPGQKANMI